jgi:hypothetical protein
VVRAADGGRLSAGLLSALGFAVEPRGQELIAIGHPFGVSVENDCNGAWAHLVLLASVIAAILFVTHVAHFVLAVQWEYAVHNAGTYHVDDLNVLHQPLWERLRNAAELRKTLVVAVYEFYAHVGRLVMPVLLWMLLADRRV